MVSYEYVYSPEKEGTVQWEKIKMERNWEPV